MRELDFLPHAYHQALRNRQQRRRNVVMTAGLVAALGALHVLNLTRINAAQAALGTLRNGASVRESTQASLAELEAKKAAARKRLDLINRLEDAAPLDAAIGEVARLLSDTMALRSFDVETVGTEAQSPAGMMPASSTPPARPTAAAGTQVRMSGIAATDVEVGIFLGKLSSCPLFSNVVLTFSRDARMAGKRMREFEVKFIVRPVENLP